MRLPLPLALGAALLVLLAAPAVSGAKTVWLCKPGLTSNPCTSPLTATVQAADGGSRIERSRPARRPRIDCFYVYPTVSAQPAIQATRSKDPELKAIARLQASRFSQRCRVFAPVYRQITLRGIASGGLGSPEMRARAYGDVRAAWRTYLRRHNRGRGVVLLGHSQGTFMLRELVTREIDRRAKVRRRLVSALLIGGNVLVERGRNRGGDFRNVRACGTARQTGCVVAYSIYDEVPPAGSIFVRAPSPDQRVLCTNPASLRGGRGLLDTYALAPAGAPTPWLAYPNRYAARCRSEGGATWLHAEPTGGAADTRPVSGPVLGPSWGLHLVDASLPLGNLVDLVRTQEKAYLRHARGR